MTTVFVMLKLLYVILSIELTTSIYLYNNSFYDFTMDLKIIKLLLGYPKDSTRYIAGVEGFVEYEFKNKPEDTKIYCPCHTCVHTSLLSRDEIYEHLVCNGILENYEEWGFHSDPT